MYAMDAGRLKVGDELTHPKHKTLGGSWVVVMIKDFGNLVLRAVGDGHEATVHVTDMRQFAKA